MCSIEGKATRRTDMVRGETYKETKKLLVLTMCGQICGSICLMDRKRKKNKDGSARNQSLDNGRQLRGIYFIEPNDEDFKLTRKAARRKWEPPMPAAMPCKLPVKSSGKPTAILGKARQNTLVLMPTKESTRPRLQGAGHKPHQDHISAKEMKFYDSLQSCSEVHSNASSIKNSRRKGSSGDGKAAVEKTLEELKKIPAW